MKKNCILLFLLCSLFAQANNPDSTNRKWQIGFNYHSSVIGDFLYYDINKKSIIHGVSITTEKKIAENISIETGFIYRLRRIESEYIPNSIQISNHHITKTNIFEVPIALHFFVIKKSNFSIFLKGGLNNSLYFEEVITEGFFPYNYSSTRFEYVNIILDLGMGAQYQINEKIGICFEPSMGFFISGMNESSVIELKTGITYHF